MPGVTNPFTQDFSSDFGGGPATDATTTVFPVVLIPASDPAHAVAVTKSDTTTYSPPLQMLRVGGSGDVAIILVGDTTPITLSAVRAGTVLNVCVTRVMATNTTATLVTGLY